MLTGELVVHEVELLQLRQALDPLRHSYMYKIALDRYMHSIV